MVTAQNVLVTAVTCGFPSLVASEPQVGHQGKVSQVWEFQQPKVNSCCHTSQGISWWGGRVPRRAKLLKLKGNLRLSLTPYLYLPSSGWIKNHLTVIFSQKRICWNIHGHFYVSRKNTRVGRLEAKFFPHTFSMSSQIWEKRERLGPLDGNGPPPPLTPGPRFSTSPPITGSCFLLRKREGKSWQKVFCLQAICQTEPQDSGNSVWN